DGAAELDALEELDELDPHAATNAANDVAAAPAPNRLPAIFKNRLRSTSSRASSSTAPAARGASLLLPVSFMKPPVAMGYIRAT
ncbi:MAG: hypothetical protein M3Y09_13560, partial [Actinomycetota bacterium]|nr:hypothetical protein [Actinomycetota bacterium]